MALSEQALGRLVMDFYENEGRLARPKALLAQTSETMELVAARIKAHPESIAVTEASFVLRDTQGGERTITLVELGAERICEVLADYQQAGVAAEDIGTRLIEVGQGRLAQALETQKPPVPDVLGRSR